MDFKDELRPFISKEEALWIRKIRVHEGYSLRAVARACSEKWKQDWGDNQLYGEDICAAAMKILNEKPNDGWY